MSLDSPVSVLYDDNGNPLAVSGSATVATSQPGLVVFGSGSDGAWHYLKLASTGEMFVTGVVGFQAGATFTANQGVGSTIANAWTVRMTDGVGQTLGTGSAFPLWITGSVTTGPATVTFPATQSIDIGRWDTGVTASVREVGGSTTVVAATLASTASAVLLNQNSSRVGATFFKEGPNTAYIKLGSGGVTSSYSVRLQNNGYYELPENYTGVVSVAFSDNVASNKIWTTEITTP